MTIADTTPPLTATIAESREWIDANREEGVSCPSCDQLAKLYRRRINSGMAQALITMYRKGGTNDFVHTPSLVRSHEVGQLAWWGFIEESKELREDGKKRSGYWRVTSEGEQWLKGNTKAAKYAVVYNGKLLELDDEEYVVIADALGTRFNYNDLMAGI